MHAVLVDIILSLKVDADPLILDAGCGTGQNCRNLIYKVSPQVYGFDISSDAKPFWRKRNLNKVCNASINKIPFKENTFDFVVCVDVLECEGVDEDLAVSEMRRVVKSGGYLILVVPAYKWLMTPEHHQAVHAIRRYSRNQFELLLSKHEIKVRRLTYIFSPVFPAIILYRLILKAIKNQAGEKPRSELKPLTNWMNRTLLAIVQLEQILVRYMNMPFGSTIVAVVQKQG